MALVLPDATALGERPAPQPNRQVASYEPPNFRTVGVAGQMVQGAGSELTQASQIIEQTNAKYDAIAADNALNQLQDRRSSLEFDPQTGFTAAKGANAVGQQFLQDYQGKFQNAASEISDGLANEQQKQMFQQRAQMAASQFQSSLMAHQAQQTTAYANDTDDASVKNALNDIAAHPYDDNTYQTSMQVANNALNSKASRSGYSAPVIQSARDSLTSVALASRVGGMMQDNPMQAADFFHQHELDFDPNTRLSLSKELKTTTDAQTSRMDGQSAYQAGVGQPSQAGPILPKDMDADTVHAYSAGRITDIINQVKASSPYDALFQKAGALYNVSPTELKLRAAAESSLNAGTPDSSQGAQGIMQFEPATAKAMGIDPRDPEQAIMGAAKLMAQAGGTLGGDMSKVDRAYYGGSTNATGPNTDQYAENLRAVRASLYGQPQVPQTVASMQAAEGSVVAQAKAVAEQRRPGDAVYADQVVAEAHKNWSLNLSAIQGQDYANYSQVLGSVVGPNGAKGLSDLSAGDQTTFSHLPPASQNSIFNLMKSNQKEDDAITPTPTTDRKALSLLGLSINDPVAFKNMDIVAATQDLPRANQTAIYSAWMGIDKKMAEGVNTQKAIQVMTKDMEIAKIALPSASEKLSESKFADYNTFTKLLSDSVTQFQAQHQRAPTQEETLAMGRPLLSQVQVPGNWYGTNTVRAFNVGPQQESQAVAPIQPAEKDAINGKLTQRYGYAPTDSQIQAFKMLSILHPNDQNALRQFDQTMKANKPRGGQSSGGIIQ